MLLVSCLSVPDACEHFPLGELGSFSRPVSSGGLARSEKSRSQQGPGISDRQGYRKTPGLAAPHHALAPCSESTELPSHQSHHCSQPPTSLCPPDRLSITKGRNGSSPQPTSSTFTHQTLLSVPGWPSFCNRPLWSDLPGAWSFYTMESSGLAFYIGPFWRYCSE